MLQRGIRGAITADENTPECIEKAVVELIEEITFRNGINPKDIVSAVFSMTKDLDCVYPAKFAREHFKQWQYVPMMCFSELDIKGALQKCIRLLITVNTQVSQEDIKHVYLKGAQILRKDITNK